MTEQRQRFILGLFVLGSLMMLAVLIFLFGSAPTFFSHRTSYTVLFNDAPGIGPGTPVRRSGVRVGEVGNVQLDPETGQVRVQILLQPSYTPRANEEPIISTGLISGDTSIDFVPREPVPNVPPDRSPIPPNTVLVGRTPPSAQKLIDPAQASLDQIRHSLERFEKLEPRFEEALDEFTRLARSSNEFVPELRRTNDSLREGFQNARTVVADIRKTNEAVQSTLKTYDQLGERMNVFVATNQEPATRAIKNIGDLAEQARTVFTEENRKNVDATLRNARQASDSLVELSKSAQDAVRDARTILDDLKKASKPLGDRTDQITRNLEQLTTELNKTLVDVRELMRAVGDSNGTVSKLLTDPTLYNNLADATEMLTKIAPRLDRILKDVEVFADKIARHPELIGAGGLVRPSAGLKDQAPAGAMPRH
jgi:phospholipid/cholesterol/gamma-HCH transport system substrate-binding protein